ncbi:MAG: 3'-5' exonuclease [Deltaproteobacteria bacterium]|jgi:DNA polymerase-3 subunit epsilon|nr:3'-5' exonuclease [Deltaproteobacteria bacterium]MBW2531896.1 3'-5' exonuclease [Deltaproteobacteria bacterium]
MPKWTELSWLCIDTETTGIDPETDRIVELGATVFQQGRLLRKMGMLLNPGMPIPAEATAVHGITDDEVAECPSLAEIADRFLEHVRRAELLVGYNWPFDAGLLEVGLGDSWRDAIRDKPIFDVLVLVRFDDIGRYWKGPGRHRLDAVGERLGVAREGKAHRASSDCIMTCRILWQLQEHLPDDAHAAAELLAEQRARQDVDFEAWRKAHPRP